MTAMVCTDLSSIGQVLQSAGFEIEAEIEDRMTTGEIKAACMFRMFQLLWHQATNDNRVADLLPF